jgi:hypothetical protein
LHGHNGPGRAGYIDLGTEIYATGASAADALGITEPVEIAFAISDAPPPHGLSSPYRTSPVVGPAGEVLRHDADIELKTMVAIAVSAKWLNPGGLQ